MLTFATRGISVRVSSRVRGWWGLLGCIAAGGMVVAPAEGQQPVVAFVDVSVIPMDRETVLPGHTVVIQGEQIVAMGPSRDTRAPKGALVVDGRGKFLMPGLTDMHVHMFGDLRNEAYTPDMLLALLSAGVTTVRDMHSGGRFLDRGYGPDSFALHTKAEVNAGRMLGPFIYTAGDFKISKATAGIPALKADGHDFLKVNDRLSKDVWVYDSINALAASVGLRVAGHVPAPLGLLGVLKARWASVEHLMGYVNHIVGFDGGYEVVGAPRNAFADTAAWLQPGARPDSARLSAIVAETRRAGVWNVPTLGTVQDIAYRKNLGNSARDSLVGARYFEFDLQIIKALHDAEAGLLIGTDVLGTGGMLKGKYAAQLQRELTLLQEADLTRYQILEIATRNAARFMDTDASVGTIAVGKRADLILLRENPLENLSSTTAPLGVMVRGRWLSRAEIDQRVEAMEGGHRRTTD